MFGFSEHFDENRNWRIVSRISINYISINNANNMNWKTKQLPTFVSIHNGIFAVFFFLRSTLNEFATRNKVTMFNSLRRALQSCEKPTMSCDGGVSKKRYSLGIRNLIFIRPSIAITVFHVMYVRAQWNGNLIEIVWNIQCVSLYFPIN